MQITVQLVDNNALGLLQYLEKLNIIRLLSPETSAVKKQNKSQKSRFAGRISASTAANLEQQLQQSREEWQH